MSDKIFINSIVKSAIHFLPGKSVTSEGWARRTGYKRTYDLPLDEAASPLVARLVAGVEEGVVVVVVDGGEALAALGGPLGRGAGRGRDERREAPASVRLLPFGRAAQGVRRQRGQERRQTPPTLPLEHPLHRQRLAVLQVQGFPPVSQHLYHSSLLLISQIPKKYVKNLYQSQDTPKHNYL